MSKEYIDKIKSLEQENKRLLEDIQKLKSQTNYTGISKTFNYLNIFERVPVGIFLFTKKLKIVEGNSAFFDIFKVSKKQIINLNIRDLEDQRILETFLLTSKGYEGFYEGEYLTSFSKEQLYISAHTKPYTFYYDGEEIDGGIAVVLDITEHSIAEEAINKTYDTFQRVTDSVNAIIYVIDPKTLNVLFMNNKANRVFGEKNGIKCFTAFFKKEKKCNYCQIDELKRKNLPLGKFLEKDYYLEEEKKWYQASYGYIEWVDGRRVMLVTSNDITVEKISLTKIQEQNRKFEDTLFRLSFQNEQINKQTEELRVSGAIKDTMFSIIAHDLRGPVGNITSALDIILDDIENITKKEIIEIVKPVRDSASSAYNLLINLLFWAKNESGETFFIKDKIILNEIIEDVLILFKPNFETKRIKLINNINEEFFVFADEHMIHTIVRNLISNAVKYTHDGGEVEIGIKDEFIDGSEFINFWVKDNGIGIQDADITKMMNSKEFFSTYGTNKEKGTGIGIILTTEFVERHNGKIIIDSKVGEGTKISILLPIDGN